MKKYFKLISKLLVICFCISFLAPINTIHVNAVNVHNHDEGIVSEVLNEKNDTSLEIMVDEENPEGSEESENLNNLEKEKIIPAEKLQERYNIKIQSPERDAYMERLSKISKFSEASKEELEAIAEYAGVDYTLLTEAEKHGYSIADSILAAKIQTNAKLTIEEIEKALLQYEDLQALYTETSKYANLISRWNFSPEIIDDIKGFLLERYDVYDFEKPAVIAEIFNVDLHDVIKRDNEGNEIWDEIQRTYSSKDIIDLAGFIFENSISVKWFLDYTDKENIEWAQFYQEVKEYYEKFLGKADIEGEDIESVDAETNTESAATETDVDAEKATDTKKEPLPVISAVEDGYKAPFTYQEYNEDRIEMNTGSLIHENVDVYLPGRNGLDFKLVSRYNSGEHECGEKEYIERSGSVTFYNVVIKYKRYIYGGPYAGTLVEEGDFEIIKDIYNSELERLEDIYNNQDNRVYYLWQGTWGDMDVTFKDILHLERNTYYSVPTTSYSIHRWFTPRYDQKDSPLGLGWSFVFDSIEIVEDKSYYNDYLGGWANYINKNKGKYLHLEDGRVYEIEDNLELKEYKLYDMRLEQDSSYTNGQNISSYYVLKYKDGIKKYFAQDGRLLAKVDRYGNTIEYQHTLIRNHPVITKIIDTLGREVTIDYDFNNLKVVVTAPGNRKITYELAQDGFLLDEATGQSFYTYSHKIVNRKDFENRITGYEYNYNTTLPFYVGDGATGVLSSNILTKITFPTGSYIEYEYADEKRFIYGGYESYPVVKKRTTVETTKNVTHLREYINDYNYTKYPFIPDDEYQMHLDNYYPKFYRFLMIDRKDYTGTIKTQCFKFNYNNQLTDKEEYRSLNYYTGSSGYLVVRRVYEQGVEYPDKNLMYNSSQFKYDSTDRQLTQALTKTYTIPASGRKQDQNLNIYLLTAEDYKYDQYANLIKYWGPDAQRNTNNQLVNPETSSYLVKYTYDTSRFHLLAQKEYRKDSSTIITETYSLTSDGKNTAQAAVKVNGTQKTKSQYAYDQWNNVNSEKRYLESGGWTSYIETNYSYLDNVSGRNSNYNFNGAYLTGKSTPGVLDADGSSVGTVAEVFKYDDYGKQINYTDPKNNATNYQYDNLGRVKLITKPDNSTISYNYDDTNNTLAVTNEVGANKQYIYDGFGNILYEKDVQTGEYLKSYEYNKDFLLKTEKNNTTSSSNYYNIGYTYYNDGRLKDKITKDSSGTTIAQETYLYEDAFDLNNDGKADCSKTTVTVVGQTGSPAIASTQYLDKNGRIIREKRVHSGSEYYTTYTYDYVGNKTQEKSSRAYNESWTESYTAKYEYDYAGRITREYNVFGDYSSMVYDALGRMVSKTDIKGNKASTPYSASYEYDKLGRLLKERVPFENVSGTIYYSTNKYYYDKNSNITCQKTTNNLPGQTETYNKTEYEYNNVNLLTKVITYDGSNPENYTQYYYDAIGNKVRMYTGLSSPLTINGLDNVTPGSDSNYSVTKYEYDRFGNLKKMTDPLSQYETYTYDLNGNMIQKTDRNQNVTTMAYDGLNRLLSKSVTTPDESGNKAYTYAYYLTGSRKSMSGDGTSVTYIYDDLGRLIQESEGSITRTYDYDASDNRKLFKLIKSGTTEINTTYTYDKMDRLKEVKENGQLIASYTYDDNGNRLSLAYNNDNSVSYQYNLANRLKEITNKKGTTTLSQYSYNYYLDGNQQKKTDYTGKVTTYVYDSLGRLTNESVTGEPAISYTYDDYNNRAAMTVAVQYVTTYGYDKNSRLITEEKAVGGVTETTRYSYDYNGNQIYKGIETLAPAGEGSTGTLAIYVSGEDAGSGIATFNEFDGLNQLIKTTAGDKTITYAYNGDGLRTSKTVNGVTTKHIWDGNQISLELNSSDVVTGKYIRGINLIYLQDSAGTKKFYLFNGHGDVVQLTSTVGSVVKSYDYDAFGVEKNPDGADANPFRYCGEYFDKETDTYYLRARYYAPGIGRFTQEDSIRGSNNDPLSLNLYTYCHNDPVNFKDPSGNEEQGDSIILYPSDYAIIKALTQDYYFYKSKNDYDAMDAIRRLSTAIRQKPEYKDKYEDGIYRDYYKYNSNSITSIANVYIEGFEYLNKIDKITSILGFVGGFASAPYGPIISAAVMASKSEVTLIDILTEASGNIPYGVGEIIGTISFITDMLGPEPYRPNDFEIQLQIVSNKGRQYNINYYMVKSENAPKRTATYNVYVPNRGKVDWQYD